MSRLAVLSMLSSIERAQLATLARLDVHSMRKMAPIMTKASWGGNRILWKTSESWNVARSRIPIIDGHQGGTELVLKKLRLWEQSGADLVARCRFPYSIACSKHGHAHRRLRSDR
jgi:hypothetical protein